MSRWRRVAVARTTRERPGPPLAPRWWVPFARRAPKCHMPVPSGVSRLVPHLARRPEPSVLGACGRGNGGALRRSWSHAMMCVVHACPGWHANCVRMGTFTVAPPGELLAPPRHSCPGGRGRWAMGGGQIRCAGGGRWPYSVCCGLAFGGTFTPAQLVMLFDLNFRPHAHVLRPIEHLAPHAVQVFLGIGMALRTQARARVGQRRTWVVAEGAAAVLTPLGGANAWAVRTLGCSSRRARRWRGLQRAYWPDLVFRASSVEVYINGEFRQSALGADDQRHKAVSQPVNVPWLPSQTSESRSSCCCQAKQSPWTLVHEPCATTC